MAKKHICKTTKEYTYDKNGYVVKEVITEESYAEEEEKESTIHTNIGTDTFIMKKAVGVPTPPLTSSVTYNTNNIVSKGQISETDLQETVRKALKNIQDLT